MNGFFTDEILFPHQEEYGEMHPCDYAPDPAACYAGRTPAPNSPSTGPPGTPGAPGAPKTPNAAAKKKSNDELYLWVGIAAGLALFFWTRK